MRKPSYNTIHHLCLGRVVLHGIGYADGEYVYQLRHNVGDVYSVDGVCDLGKVVYDLRTTPVQVRIESEIAPLVVVMADLGTALAVIAQGWRSD